MSESKGAKCQGWSAYDPLRLPPADFWPDRKLKLVLDAEYTWYQVRGLWSAHSPCKADLPEHLCPSQAAIDAFQLSLMREFNAAKRTSSKEAYVEPLVYGTYQAYLRR